MFHPEKFWHGLQQLIHGLADIHDDWYALGLMVLLWWGGLVAGAFFGGYQLWRSGRRLQNSIQLFGGIALMLVSSFVVLSFIYRMGKSNAQIALEHRQSEQRQVQATQQRIHQDLQAEWDFYSDFQERATHFKQSGQPYLVPVRDMNTSSGPVTPTLVSRDLHTQGGHAQLESFYQMGGSHYTALIVEYTASNYTICVADKTGCEPLQIGTYTGWCRNGSCQLLANGHLIEAPGQWHTYLDDPQIFKMLGPMPAANLELIGKFHDQAVTEAAAAAWLQTHQAPVEPATSTDRNVIPL